MPDQSDVAMVRWLRSMVPRSRQRAVQSRFVHDLAGDHAERLFQHQGGCCAISGLPFSLARFADVLVKHPFAPSLDRISSKGGYTADNVRLVCVAVNFGMGQWGQELYLTFARAAVERSDQTSRPPAAATQPASNDGLLSVEETEDIGTWMAEQQERIAAAEAIAAELTGHAWASQRRRIASLKRNLTLGPRGLKAAAAKAVRTRSVRAGGSD